MPANILAYLKRYYWFARMIPRIIGPKVEAALARQAGGALIGPRQVGETTLAHEIAKKR
jgi:hypothetical protein